MNFELICYISSSACEHQHIGELGKNEVIVTTGERELLNPYSALYLCILQCTLVYCGVLQRIISTVVYCSVLFCMVLYCIVYYAVFIVLYTVLYIYCYIASVNTKLDWLICGHVGLHKCNVSRRATSEKLLPAPTTDLIMNKQNGGTITRKFINNDFPSLC